MVKQTLGRKLQWIYKGASLQELIDGYPEIWQSVGPELVGALEYNRSKTFKDFAVKAKSDEDTWLNRIRKSRHNIKVIESAIPHLIRSRMAILAMDKCYQSAAVGKTSGKFRFNLINGYIIQKLLFSHSLTRKPVSIKRFRFWWRLTGQKRLLMPLVQPKGIYCFYSRELIEELYKLIGFRPGLEIGAGDGTLSRFLSNEGARMHATDNYSWTHTIEYPAEVERLDAKQALDRYLPKVVVCSWPPPGNSFEQKVFNTQSVEIYIVIGSRHKFASGNWKSYQAQRGFDLTIDQNLSALVIPPELDSAVLVFRRKTL
jgi:hypothetical protein